MLVLNVFSIHEVSVKKNNIIIFIANKTLAGKAIQYNTTLQTGADPGFQVRGAQLKKLRRAEGGAKIVWVFRVKNHDFTPKNHIFSNFSQQHWAKILDQELM